MKTKFLTVLFLFFACIFISNAQQRIIGGETIDISQAPYQVAIFNNSKQTFGGGMLLNNQWILTAKHIVEVKLFFIHHW